MNYFQQPILIVTSCIEYFKNVGEEIFENFNNPQSAREPWTQFPARLNTQWIQLHLVPDRLCLTPHFHQNFKNCLMFQGTPTSWKYAHCCQILPKEKVSLAPVIEMCPTKNLGHTKRSITKAHIMLVDKTAHTLITLSNYPKWTLVSSFLECCVLLILNNLVISVPDYFVCSINNFTKFWINPWMDEIQIWALSIRLGTWNCW